MTNPNDPAYGRLEYQPMGNEYDGTTCVGHFTVGGLTKRERFAAMVMQEVLTNDDGFGLTAKEAGELLGVDNYSYIEHYPALCALMSVRFADALIEALNTPKETT